MHHGIDFVHHGLGLGLGWLSLALALRPKFVALALRVSVLGFDLKAKIMYFENWLSSLPIMICCTSVKLVVDIT